MPNARALIATLVTYSLFLLFHPPKWSICSAGFLAMTILFLLVLAWEGNTFQGTDPRQMKLFETTSCLERRQAPDRQKLLIQSVNLSQNPHNQKVYKS